MHMNPVADISEMGIVHLEKRFTIITNKPHRRKFDV